MYSDSNNLINKCAETMQGQFALNVGFLDSVFQAQRNWINRAIDQQQAINKTVLNSDDLSQVSESTQAYAEGMVENWLSDCQGVYKVLQQQGEEVSNLYCSTVDGFEKSTKSPTNKPVIVKKQAVKEAKPAVKAKQPVVRKALAKKAVASTTKSESVARVVKKKAASGSSETKPSVTKNAKQPSTKRIDSTVKVAKPAVKMKPAAQAESKVEVKKTTVKIDKPAVIEKKVESITAQAKQVQSNKPLTTKTTVKKASVNSGKE